MTFLVSTNPGQPLQPIAKVASGGELSRMSLAIQVITAQKVDTPSLIFDEVDVGISGPTAAVVGKLLRKLGESTQVLCVTHLPQVQVADTINCLSPNRPKQAKPKRKCSNWIKNSALLNLHACSEAAKLPNPRSRMLKSY